MVLYNAARASTLNTAASYLVAMQRSGWMVLYVSLHCAALLNRPCTMMYKMLRSRWRGRSIGEEMCYVDGDFSK